MENYLAQNKTEELGYDLWDHFVIPPYYHMLNIFQSKKSKVIIGGRGCGKTMLLRYLCHRTRFSKKRMNIPEEELSHIGLYWRIDTQFASLMNHRDLKEDEWRSAFGHMSAILIAEEVIRSIESIATSKLEKFQVEDLENFDFKELNIFFSEHNISKFCDLKTTVGQKKLEFELWINNIGQRQRPTFIPKQFIEHLINTFKSQNVIFSNATFFLYLDEYENLLTYQQKIVNTWLKHSESPLIFNLAMKRNSFKVRETIGNETLSDIHDFRQFDIESLYEEFGFEVFAAEILCKKLFSNDVSNSPIDLINLNDPHKLSFRKEGKYKVKLDDFVTNMFPNVSQKEIANELFLDEVLKKRLRNMLQKALEKRGNYPLSDFYLEDFPEATIVMPALLHRPSITIDGLKEEITKLMKGETNKFYGKTSWIQNNFVGCMLMIYGSLNRISPFYAGFSTFCKLSHGNIRHLIELCHKSIGRASFDASEPVTKVNPKFQAEAALQASEAFLNEIKTFGRYGNSLHTFVLRLGGLFHHAHIRPTQSEPEQNHFSITGGILEEKEYEFIEEAIKWSVLYQEKSTKQKSLTSPDTWEYILNPIYAPYFNISYRKKRKLELQSTDVINLMNGSIDEYEILLKKHLKHWGIGIDTNQHNLFSNLKLAESDED